MLSTIFLQYLSEFNFLVIGHEFDHYPKKTIRDIRNWDWFLDEHKEEDSDEDEVSDRKPKKGKRRKRKKGGANDDEDDDVWTGVLGYVSWIRNVRLEVCEPIGGTHEKHLEYV
ncbi:hypothetical protein Tco_0268057 [Tanacetum coccineum]